MKKKVNMHIKSSKLTAFTGRTTDASMRPCIFKDKRKMGELSRNKWKNDLKKGLYD